MSTRSSIAVQHKDGSVSAVYCHFDGYLAGVGAALLKHHRAFEAAESLVGLGDLSCVQHDGNVEAYSRDRGEEFDQVKPSVFPTLNEYLSDGDLGDNGYRYIFTDGEWKVFGRAVGPTPAPLVDAIAKDVEASGDE